MGMVIVYQILQAFVIIRSFKIKSNTEQTSLIVCCELPVSQYRFVQYRQLQHH
jgi:hypothetical protein